MGREVYPPVGVAGRGRDVNPPVTGVGGVGGGRWHAVDRVYTPRTGRALCGEVLRLAVRVGVFDPDRVPVEDPANQVRIETNMAAMHWEAGETAQAEQRYRSALATAELVGDATDRMSALEGLADCRRRWGDYASAMPLARRR